MAHIAKKKKTFLKESLFYVAGLLRVKQ